MDPQHPSSYRHHHHPHLHNLLPGLPVSSPSSPQLSGHRLGGVTPASSPGVFSPTASSPHIAANSPVPDSNNSTSPNIPQATPYVTTHKPVRETHIANVDRDFATGRKTINEYQVLEEIGRGQHGKVKLARDSLDGRLVAIKIIPRLSKTRRLGKVSAVDPQQNTKREIAILKKIRHENVVALLEVIDDPELQKIYMVLEHVERGEVTWRKKGLPNVCYFERYRFEKGIEGRELAPGECNWHAVLERKATIRSLKEARAAGLPPPVNQWTTQFGVTADDDDDQPPWWYVPSAGLGPDTTTLESRSVSRVTSRAPSRVASTASVASGPAPRSYSSEASPLSVIAQDGDAGSETPGVARSDQAEFDGSMFGGYVDEPLSQRNRSPSVADSIMSHVSGLDFNSVVHDPYADDFSYVPCFNIEQARSAFRDTVLGLEYLHYHGVVHRDIKPANLLWTRSFRVKISDFGVSYFGRPIRDGEPDPTISEAEARDFDDDRELSKTVGTPAFFAPELCYTDIDKEPPRVSEQIDVWSLGVTLYCLLFARIPFLAEDEFSMFRKIATEDCYLSPCRLKPVAIYTDPTGSSLYQRTNVHPYRSDADPEYEELSSSLLDLLRRMLIKNPEKRIRLRDVKRHPWVTEDIDNVPEWLEKTDPARSQERRIHVDDAEIGGAVVPLNFLQRARSAVKRAVDKVMHARERDDSTVASSRNRATSSAASSIIENSATAIAVTASASSGIPPVPSLPSLLQHNSGNNNASSSGGSNSGHGIHSGNSSSEHVHGHIHSLSQGHNLHHHYPSPLGSHHNSILHHSNSTHPRDARRKSLRGDDYFSTVTQIPSEHPLSQSVTASPYDSSGEKTPSSEFAQPLMSSDRPVAPAAPTKTLQPNTAGAHCGIYNADGSGEANCPPTLPRPMTRHVHSRSITNAILSRSAILREIYGPSVSSMPPPVSGAAVVDTPSTPNIVRLTRELRESTDANFRSQSVDRAGTMFTSESQRAAPVGLGEASAHGVMQQLRPTLHQTGSSGSGVLARTDTASETDNTTASDETVNIVATNLVPPAESERSPPTQELSVDDKTSITQEVDSQPATAAAGTAARAAIAAAESEERPATAHRMLNAALVAVRSGGRAKSNSLSVLTHPELHPTATATDPASIPCPPSPRQSGTSSAAAVVNVAATVMTATTTEGTQDRPVTTPTATSSSSASLEGFNQTPMTSPSDMTHHSFVGSHGGHRKGSSNAMMTFQSDPSLPALLSGASSVSADMEGDFLGNPGVVDGPSLVEAADSLTPPAPNKEVSAAPGFPLDQNQEHAGLKEQPGWGSGGAIPVALDTDHGANSNTGSSKARSPLRTPIRANSRNFTDEEEDSDSDGGIVMAKSKKRGAFISRETTPLSHGGRTHSQMARRRDTNTSIGSTDTAKKVGGSQEN